MGEVTQSGASEQNYGKLAMYVSGYCLIVWNLRQTLGTMDANEVCRVRFLDQRPPEKKDESTV